MCSAGFVTRPPRTTRTKAQFAGKGKPVPRAQIKDEKTYQKLRERGESKE